MTTVRQKILDYILEHRIVTTGELSKVFRVTPANIRYHLSILSQQGSIKTTDKIFSGQKGRPIQIYTPTQLENQNNLDRLSSAFFELCLNPKDNTSIVHLTTKLAEIIGTNFNIDSTNPTKRLYATIDSLNRMHYQAHWEAHRDNPRIMLSHCPYRAILDDHPELCRMDSALLEFFLHTPVSQTEKLVQNMDGIPQCVFHINKRTL